MAADEARVQHESVRREADVAHDKLVAELRLLAETRATEMSAKEARSRTDMNEMQSALLAAETKLRVAEAEVKATAQVAAQAGADADAARLLATEERARHETTHLELSSAWADATRARDGTALIIDEMQDWMYHKAVLTCQRVVRRRQDARQFRLLMSEAVRHQREVNAVQAELDLARTLATAAAAETEGRLASEVGTFQLKLREADMKLSAAQAGLNAARVAQSQTEMKLSAKKSQVRSKAEAEAQATADAEKAWAMAAEVREHHEQVHAESQAAQVQLESEITNAADLHAAQLAEERGRHEVVQRRERATSRSDMESELQESADVHASHISNTEARFRGEVNALQMALSQAEMKLSAAEAEIRVKSTGAAQAAADAEATRALAAEERGRYEAQLEAADAQMRQDKSEMQSLLSAVEAKVSNADMQMSLTTEEALQAQRRSQDFEADAEAAQLLAADRERKLHEDEAIRLSLAEQLEAAAADAAQARDSCAAMQDTMDKRTLMGVIQKIKNRTVAKAFAAWRAFAAQSIGNKHKMHKVILRLENQAISNALLGWRDSVADAIRLRVVVERATIRMRNSVLAKCFTTWADGVASARTEREHADRHTSVVTQQQALVIEQQAVTALITDEMLDLMYHKAVSACQRAIRKKQAARQFRALMQEAVRQKQERVAIQSELEEACSSASQAAVQHAEHVSQKDTFYRAELSSVRGELSESMAESSETLAEQDEYFSVQMRGMQESLLDAETKLLQKEQLEDEAKQLHEQKAEAALRMQAELLAEAEQLIATKEKCKQREDTVAKREAEVIILRAEADAEKTAMVDERNQRAQKESEARVVLRTLEAKQHKMAEREVTLVREVEGLKQRVEEQVRQMSKQARQMKRAEERPSLTARSAISEAEPPVTRTPKGPKVGSPQSRSSAKQANSPQAKGGWALPHKPRSTLPKEERKAKGITMLQTHGTAAARVAAAKQPPAVVRPAASTLAEINSLSAELEAQAAAEAAAAAQAEAAAEVARAEAAAVAAESEALESLGRGLPLNMFIATGKLKHERWFWINSNAELNWGKAARYKDCKTELLRRVIDGPSIPDASELFASMDKNGDGVLNVTEVAALYKQARGEKMSKKAQSAAMSAMDLDGSGAVERAEFEQWWAENAASDLEAVSERAIAVEVGDGEDATVLRVVAPSVEAKAQLLLGLQAVLRRRG